MTEFYAKNYGIQSGEDISEKLVEIFIDIQNTQGEKTLFFEKGTYYFDSEKCEKHKLFITNTAGDEEYDKDETPHIQAVAFFMNGVDNFTLDGNDSIFIIDGKVTNMAIINCQNVTVKNVEIRHAHPDMHELCVISKTLFSVDFAVDKDTNYKFIDGKMYFYGKDYCYKSTLKASHSWWNGTIHKATPDKIARGPSPLRNAIKIKDLGDHKIRVYYPNTRRFTEGDCYYPYDVRRQFAGIFLDKSTDIVLENIKQRFNYSLALVAQNSENITLKNSEFAPESGSPRKMASVADFIQFCMCRGQLNVFDNYFDGAGDDLLNIHGIHFLIKEKNNNKIKIAFMHTQTHGFNPLRVGDTLASIDIETLLEKGTSEILGSKLLNETELEITLSNADNFNKGDVVEDVSACPNMTFKNNKSTRIITRGLLITTRGKVVVENNLFKSTTMSGILLSDDAKSWYESGMCCDVTIKDNTFEYCGETPIRILPENKSHKGAVHKNIKIIGNKFKKYDGYCITAKSTNGLHIENNEFLNDDYLKTENCENVVF